MGRRLGKMLRIAALVIAVAVAALVITAYFVFRLPEFGGRAEGGRLERMRRSPEYIGGRFENIPPQNTDLALIETFKLYSQGQVRTPPFPLPVVELGANSLKVPASTELMAIWFGHASVLIELNGVRIMVDPVLSDVVSPVPMVYGPRRFHPPPIALEQLSNIDAVVISHDHYDHLDMKTVQHLAPQGTHFYVGLGVGAHLERWGVPPSQIHEMDWWEAIDLKGIQIACTPARHYSGRRSMDNPTLWASWVIRGANRSVYVSGDTGYAGHFRDIRKRFGDMDLTIMKVGAYGDTWLDIHMDPESAVQSHLDLGGKVLLPVHWATFDLSYHAWDEPIYRTLKAAGDKDVQVITPRVGERFEFGRPFENTEWYRQQSGAKDPYRPKE